MPFDVQQSYTSNADAESHNPMHCVQGALIATALVMLQQPESRVAPFRKQVSKFIHDKHEEVMCRMGAIMAAGEAHTCSLTCSCHCLGGVYAAA